jgi:hypothetical protein
MTNTLITRNNYKIFAEKIFEAANLILIALVIRQALEEKVKLAPAIIGFIAFVLLYYVSLSTTRKPKT